MSLHEHDLTSVLRSARSLLGHGWERWPGGYPNAIELALVDAVFSIRARYGHPANGQGDRATGVPAIVARWRTRDGAADYDDLRHILELNVEEIATTLHNRTQTSGRLKAEALREAAHNLAAVGVRSAEDLRQNRETAKSAYVRVRGLGWVTFSYLCMLLQVPDVKADTWITRFVDEATGRPHSQHEAYELVHAAANHFRTHSEDSMPQDPASLDHALWFAARSKNRGIPS